MTAEQLFSIANAVALGGWLPWISSLVTGAILPLLFAVLYAGLLLGNWGAAEGGFSSLAAVESLFSNQWMLLAGWVHYLAFDLFIGSWQVRDARRYHDWCAHSADDPPAEAATTPV